MRLAVCAAVACACAFVHGNMDTASAATRGRISVPSPARAEALALGFEPVIADYYWIQALQVAGSREVSKADSRLLGDLVELVTTLDPWVDHPYRFAALWLVHDVDEVRRANGLLEKAIAYHPLEWRNRFYLGYNQFFYLGDDGAAADTLEGALAFEAAPDYLGAFVTRLRASADSLDTAALFLDRLIHETADEGARAGYVLAFDEVETERRARYLDGARTEFRRRHGRDIREPAELWQGPLRVVADMPPAHPRKPGHAWTLAADGEIVSSFYGNRYRIHVHPTDEDWRREWHEQAREAEAGAEDTAPPGKEPV